MKTIVLKFGGASVTVPEDFSRIADIVLDRSRQFDRVAVVVSAMGDSTNRLIELAKKVHPDPPRREYDMLVTTGERISIALLAMALSLKQCQAMSFTGSQTGIITCERHTDARIVDVKPYRILPYLNNKQVVIVAGFQGVSRKGEITTLGRGGSDTSAVALGIALEASCVEFFKDVPGVYNKDPKKHVEAELYQYLDYYQALSIVSDGSRILHSRCIHLAMRNGLPLHVSSFKDNGQKVGTIIHQKDFGHNSPAVYEIEES